MDLPEKGARTGKPPMLDVDFSRNPFIVIWEVTQACDLACVHCRAEARPWRDSRELSTEEGKKLIDQIAQFGSPLFVITGGDPLKRPDLFELIDYAVAKGLRTTLTPSGTRLMTPEVIRRLKEHGLSRLAVSLDGSCAAVHDEFRKVDGRSTGRSGRSGARASWTCRCRSTPRSASSTSATSTPSRSCSRRSTSRSGPSSSWSPSAAASAATSSRRASTRRC